MLIHTSSGESVFKDVNSLHPDYIPPEILFRGRELNKLRFLREGLLYKPANYRRVFITGGRGQGKTLLTRFFARENSETQKGLYVDCLECKGKVTLILHRIIGWFKPGFPSGGYSLEELKSILTTIFEDRREKVLLILDDSDFLIYDRRSRNWEALQETLKSNVFDSTLPLTIYVLNNASLLKNLDFLEQTMIKSDILELKDYSKQEVEKIIRFRADLAFRESVLERGFLERVTENTFSSGGNLRYALELMLKAGEIANLNKAGVVSLEHLSKAESIIHPNLNGHLLKKLGVHEKILLISVAKRLKETSKNEVSISEVEEEYGHLCICLGFKPRTHTMLLHYVKTLSLLGFIEHELSGPGYRGKTTLLSLPNASPELVEFRVKEELGI